MLKIKTAASTRCRATLLTSPRGRMGLVVRAEHSRQVALQGGNAYWLLDHASDQFYNVHGSTFIIQRPEAYAQVFPKLRLRKLHQRPLNLTVAPKREQGRSAGTALIKCGDSWPAVSHLPVVFDHQQPFIDVTQLLEELVEVPEAPVATCGMVPCAPAPGLVAVPDLSPPLDEQGENGQEVFIGSSTSPRRTRMVGFTCLRCHARSYKPVNPLAFEEGTLVVQCGKCQCWHKIRDHLHLFHDMAGELFFRPSPITEADIPEALRMPLEPFYWTRDESDDGESYQ